MPHLNLKVDVALMIFLCKPLTKYSVSEGFLVFKENCSRKPAEEVVDGAVAAGLVCLQQYIFRSVAITQVGRSTVTWAAEIIRCIVASVKEPSTSSILAIRPKGLCAKSRSFETVSPNIVGISQGKAGCGADFRTAPARELVETSPDSLSNPRS